jgi:hypothetical protein
MKAKEAIEVLKQLDPNKEVYLHFESDGNTDSMSCGTWNPGDSRTRGTDHPNGGSYETQAEYFGRQ